MVHDGPKLIAPILFLGQSYPKKLFSISFGEISRNSISHQIEPTYNIQFGNIHWKHCHYETLLAWKQMFIILERFIGYWKQKSGLETRSV